MWGGGDNLKVAWVLWDEFSGLNETVFACIRVALKSPLTSRVESSEAQVASLGLSRVG
jgi:hypothetical protein